MKRELTPIQEELRKWLHKDGIYWSKRYERLPTNRVVELIEKYRSRANVEMEEAERVARKQMEEPDEEPGNDFDAPCSTLMHDTGGGRRVIRSTRHLGG